MTGDATDTFSWSSLEGESTNGELRETVDFADVLKATVGAMRPESKGRAGTNAGRAGGIPPAGDLDACDGILAQERLEDADWVDWPDVRRELQCKD